MKHSKFIIAAGFAGICLAGRLLSTPAEPLTIVRSSANEAVATLRTERPHFETIETAGHMWQTIPLNGSVQFGRPGQPGLPVETRWIEVPTGSSASLDLHLGEVVTIPDVDLAPVPSLSTDDPIMATIEAYDKDAYQRDEFIPADYTTLEEPILIGDSRFVLMTISPYRYNAFRRELIYATEIKADLKFTPSPNQEPDRQTVPAWRDLSRTLSDLPPRDDLSHRTDNLGHLVIVIPNTDAYSNSVAPLVDWKKRMGYVVTVVRLVRDVGNSAAALKTFLETAWEEWDIPPSFVLLVGDASLMPCFRDGDAEGTSWYISDNQYVTYGYNEGNDIAGWIPQSFIGRLPAGSALDAAQMAAKIVGYESVPVQENWVEGGLLIAAGVHSCIQTNQAIREMMEEYGYQRNNVHEAYTEFHAGQPNVDANFVTNSVNEGVGFVNFRGYSQWGGYTIQQIRGLRNAWKLPIVTGMVCATNDYANRFGVESIGEAWIRAYNNNVPCGAVATFGPSDRYAHSQFNNTLSGEFYRLLFRRGVHTLGALCVGSKLSLLRNYPSFLTLGRGNESVGYYFFTYTLFGDPSMQVRTRDPQEMSVTFADVLPIGTTNLMVTVSDNEDAPVAGAYIHYYGDDDHRWGAYTDSNGEALIEVPPLDEGSLLLTVTATNFIPFMDGADVVVQDRYVSLTSLEIDDDNEGDSRGNGNGEINPGETIGLSVTLTNRGAEGLENVTAILASASPYVQINRSAAEFGNAGQGAEIVSNPPFVIEIRPETPSGTTLEFLLNVTSGEDQFPITFSQQVTGYEFGVVSFETVGGEPLTPGVTRRLIVTIENTGSLPSTELFGTLYCTSHSIQINGAEARFEALAAGRSGNNTNWPFEVTAGVNAYRGCTVNFGLLLEDETGLRDSIAFTMTLGEPTVTSPQGPDDYGYWAIDSRDTVTGIEPTYERLQGDANLNLTDNNDVANGAGISGEVEVIDLPFPFIFYGERYERATVSSNGWLAFGETVTIGWNNQELGSGLTPAAMIAPWWDDLYGGSVFTRFDEDNSRFIIEWRNFNSLAGHNLILTLVLYDPTVAVTATGDGEIVINYTDVPEQRDFADEKVTIGIASPDSKTSLTVRHGRISDMRTGLLSSGMAVKFTTGESHEVGSLAGRVIDVATNARMSGVRVMLTGTGFFATTDVNGDYRIDGAAVGAHSVLARKRYFNDDMEADVEIRRNETTIADFSLTHPIFSIDIEEIDVTVPPDSILYRNFRISNDGNGPLDFDLVLTYPQEEQQRDRPWDVLFDWDVSATTGEQNLRGVAQDDDFFYFAGQRVRAVYPHPIFILNKLGESVREFDQISIDSAARGYSGMDFNGENLVAVEERSIVEFSRDGDFVRSILTPERTSLLCLAYAHSLGTYFTKGIIGGIVYQIDPEGNLIGEYRTPENSFRTYGFAWYPADPDSFYLYVMRYNQEITQAELWRMNPQNNEWQMVRVMEFQEGDLPFDIVITKHYDPLKWTLGVLVNRAGGDHFIGYELAPNSTWINYDPPSGAVPPGRAQDIEVEFKAEDMPVAEYNVVLGLYHNAIGNHFDIPITFTVGQVGIPTEADPLPAVLKLNSIYPNPFNSSIAIEYGLPVRNKIKVGIYDLSGREVVQLANGEQSAGYHRVIWNAESSPSGIYICRLESSGQSRSTKLILTR